MKCNYTWSTWQCVAVPKCQRTYLALEIAQSNISVNPCLGLSQRGQSLVKTNLRPHHLTSSTDFVSNASSMTERQKKSQYRVNSSLLFSSPFKLRVKFARVGESDTFLLAYIRKAKGNHMNIMCPLFLVK